MSIKPITTLCFFCKFYLEEQDKSVCKQEKFILSIAEGKISVPLDWDCYEFESDE